MIRVIAKVLLVVGLLAGSFGAGYAVSGDPDPNAHNHSGTALHSDCSSCIGALRGFVKQVAQEVAPVTSATETP